VAQRRIVYTLWISIGLSILWVAASVVTVIIMVADGAIVFHWLQQRYEILQISPQLYTFHSLFILLLLLPLAIYQQQWKDILQKGIHIFQRVLCCFTYLIDLDFHLLLIQTY
jgi:hypothetical protein